MGLRSLLKAQVGLQNTLTPSTRLHSLLADLKEVARKLKEDKKSLILVIDDLEEITGESAKEAFKTFRRHCRTWAKDNELKILLVSSSSFVSAEMSDGDDVRIFIGELPKDEARDYLQSQIQKTLSNAEEEEILGEIGGKISDLRLLCTNINHEIKRGNPSQGLVKEMISQFQADVQAAFFPHVLDLTKLKDALPKKKIFSLLKQYDEVLQNKGTVTLPDIEDHTLLSEFIDCQILAYGEKNSIKFGSKSVQKAFAQTYSQIMKEG